MDIYKLRILTEVVDYEIHSLPVVFTGSLQECRDYASNKGYYWRVSNNNIMKGFFVSPQGDTIFLTLT